MTATATNPFDVDSPEMSSKEMQKLLLKLVSKMPATPEPEPENDSETQIVTRSSSGKKKQTGKRQKISK